MALRTITYNATETGVTPAYAQNAGVQGEHNATKVVVNLSAELVTALRVTGAVYRFEYVDGVNQYDSTANATLPDTATSVNTDIPNGWTVSGGQGEIRLVIAQLDAGGLTLVELYSLPCRVYFASRSTGDGITSGTVMSGLSTLIANAEDATSDAHTAAAAANLAAASVNSAISSANTATSNATAATTAANTATSNANSATSAATAAATLANEKAALADNAAAAANTAKINADTAASSANSAASSANTAAINVTNMYDELVDDGVLQANIAEKLTELETTYAPRLTAVEDAINEPYHLYVGQNQKYTTITAAVNEWRNAATINKQPTIIHIMKGLYVECIPLYGENCNISFIGEDKNLVTWKTTEGYYANHPLSIGGNCLIKNITFIADHSGTPDYEYTTSGSYALHVDVSGATGTVKIDNCILKSYQNAGLGTGTSTNQQIEVTNCDIYNYSTWALSIANGAWLYHSSATAGAVNQRVRAVNCRFYCAGGRAVELQSYNSDTTPIPLEIIGCSLSSDTITNNADLVHFAYGAGATANKINITPNSFGNNVESLNSPASSWQKAVLTQASGLCKLVDDCNSVRYGFFMCAGAAGGLNTPTAAWYTGLAITYSLSDYTVQYAWSITTGFQCYKRSCSAGVWSAWSRVYQTLSDINEYFSIDSTGYAKTVTDLNNALKCGYYQIVSGSNTPSAGGSYYVHVVSANNGYVVQYAWDMTSGAKHKRTKIASTWSSWTTITE